MYENIVWNGLPTRPRLEKAPLENARFVQFQNASPETYHPKLWCLSRG